MFKQKSFRGSSVISVFLRRLILSWLISVLTEYLILPNELRNLSTLDGLAQMSLSAVIGRTVVFTVLLTGIACVAKTEKAERFGIVLVFAVLEAIAFRSNASGAFLAVCALISVGLVVFCVYGRDESEVSVIEPKKAHRAWVWMTVGLSAAFFLFVSAWTVGRFYSFGTPTFDFGIFSQMFYYMKKFGLPMTTVERDGLLSHFAVHVSPIYYLMLPFYRLFPTPAVLQVLQAAVITSAVIPLWKIGKHHGLTGAQRMLICAVLLLYPAFSGGTSYDIHENCFLTPLILWLFYGIERKNAVLTVIAAALTLTVKEDAAVYVAVIALWLIVKTALSFKKSDFRNFIVGLSLLTASVVWFLLVTGYLSKYGDGVMTYRYGNFIYDGSSSLLTVIKAVILNPMKAIYECVDSEKLYFIAMTLLPLLGLPLLTRRYERYILLIPYVLVNLMSDYPYQHDIFFQYTFGSSAFLLYLTVVNLADWRSDRQRLCVFIGAFVVSVVYFASAVVPKAVHYPVQAIRDYGQHQNIRDVLDTIPEEASVTATGFYTAYLSQREILYDVLHCSRKHLLETEYVVLRVDSDGECVRYATDGENNGYENLTALLRENGYSEYGAVKDVLIVWRKEDEGPSRSAVSSTLVK